MHITWVCLRRMRHMGRHGWIFAGPHKGNNLEV